MVPKGRQGSSGVLKVMSDAGYSRLIVTLLYNFEMRSLFLEMENLEMVLVPLLRYKQEKIPVQMAPDIVI